MNSVSLDKEELTKFWKSSASGSGSRNSFKGFFDIVRERALFNSLAQSYLWKN